MTKDQIIEQIEKSFRDYKGSNEAIDDAAFYIESEFKKYKNTDILPADVTLSDIKKLRNYFGEHDVSLFEHRAFEILDKIIKHLE